jgi:hypothetical protein
MRSVEATSIHGFIQQLAISYVGKGYFFFVTGIVPAHKNPRNVDQKLCTRYEIHRSKWARARKKASGHSNHALIRFGRFFVLLATHGKSDFFVEEGNRVRDARKTPIRFQGYAISHRGGRVHVRIDQKRYLETKCYLVGIAPHRSVTELLAEVRQELSFEPYAPIRSQMFCILRAVNRCRAEAGLEPLPRTCFRLRRRIVKPFARSEDADAA